MASKEKVCKICSEKTDSGFNIKFKLVPICERCAAAIFLQQATWYVTNQEPNSKTKQQPPSNTL